MPRTLLTHGLQGSTLMIGLWPWKTALRHGAARNLAQRSATHQQTSDVRGRGKASLCVCHCWRVGCFPTASHPCLTLDDISGGCSLQDSLPEWSKGVDSSSTSASCVGSNPTAVNSIYAVCNERRQWRHKLQGLLNTCDHGHMV